VSAESDTEKERNPLVQGMTVENGVAIYVYDVSFDLHIQNISGGGSAAVTEALWAEDIIF
jgi:hypothetical protein